MTSPHRVSVKSTIFFLAIYDWAGKYRIINIEKRERLLAGRSVCYSNDEEIPNDLESAFPHYTSRIGIDTDREQL